MTAITWQNIRSKLGRARPFYWRHVSLSHTHTHTHTHILAMVKSTIIARVSDGLPLAASMDDEQVLLQ